VIAKKWPTMQFSGGDKLKRLCFITKQYGCDVKAVAALVLYACLRVWLQGFSDDTIGEVLLHHPA
jgi:hypothetical protein